MGHEVAGALTILKVINGRKDFVLVTNNHNPLGRGIAAIDTKDQTPKEIQEGHTDKEVNQDH
ncbi:hypothetical protein QP363_12880, partial [Corynebacterium sp. UMB6689]|nr:hypothetical protein [Corynebacterium sp. UMB6689]